MIVVNGPNRAHYSMSWKKTYSEVLEVLHADIVAKEMQKSILKHAPMPVTEGDMNCVSTWFFPLSS